MVWEQRCSWPQPFRRPKPFRHVTAVETGSFSLTGRAVFTASPTGTANPAVTIAVVMDEPKVIRAFVDGGPPRSISVGLPGGINYLFEARSLKLFVINGGYHTLQFTLYGLVLGLWH